MRSFWFGKELPSEFTDPIVRNQLSFNGQLHFRCRSCNEVSWGDVTFGKLLLEKGATSKESQLHPPKQSWFKRFFVRTASEQGFEKRGADLPCPNCQKHELDVIRFIAIESRLCKECGAQAFSNPGDPFECAVCQSNRFAVAETLIHPSYPRRLFALLQHNEPFGESPNEDVKFFIDYVRALRMSPQFHRSCIHFISFIESIFEHIYGSSADAIELLNVASALMRTIYKETGDQDAAYLSIALMMEGRDLAVDPIQRAVYGLNISQNIYSVLARREDELLRIRFDVDPKEYGIWLSRQTLTAFEEIDEDWLAELRARQKWLLGDILKAGDPSETQIDESLQWFDAALQDPALPLEVTDYVRESAFAAQAKRRNLKLEERRQLQSSLAEIAEKHLEQTDGLQRINSLTDLLRGEARNGQSQQWQNLALRCLGEAMIYTAANDPSSMLRYAGTLLSRLVSGFAAERFASGSPLEGIAGVEAFRSLAIEHGNVATNIGHHVHDLEIQLLTSALLSPGETKDPVQVAETMLAEHTKSLKNNFKEVLRAESGRFIIWFDVCDGIMHKATITLKENELLVQASSLELDLDTVGNATSLPMADDPPGRLRAQRVQRALAAGCGILSEELEQPPDHPAVIVGTSMLGAWPFDAAEVIHFDQVDTLRPMIFAPSITVASSARKSRKDRQVAKVLVVSYGGNDLPGVHQEIEGIKDAYGTRITFLEGDAICKTELLEALTGTYEVLHFCGHGAFDYLKPMQSRLYYHNKNSSDGFITAAEILRCGTIGHDPVVVLSACSSALVMPNGSNNFLGLAGALLRTGATSIVGARWPVSDSICAAFSRHLHIRLAQGDSVDRGVAHAKNMLRDARIDEWTAFMSIGG